MRTVDVVVVGGGVMGAASAWQLVRRGLDVVLLERFAPGHDRGSSHGSSRIFRLAYPDPFYVGLARRALREWLELEEEGARPLLHLTGSVDHGDPSGVRQLHDSLHGAGEPASLISAAEAMERWPGLRFDGTVLVHAHAGRVDADAAVAALHATVRTRGADVRCHTQVARIHLRPDGLVEVVTGTDTVLARSAVVAAGAWTASLLAGLVPLPPVRVTREQPAHFAPYDAATPWPSFIHHPVAALTGRGDAVIEGYGLGSPDGVKVGFHGSGPTVDPDRRDDEAGEAWVDSRLAARVREYVSRWVPGVDPATARFTPCLYDLTPDNDFVIDRRGPLTVLAGFSGHGFKFAPVIGALAADLVLGTGRAPDRFSLTRAVPSPG